jgi:hypothetical protein
MDHFLHVTPQSIVLLYKPGKKFSAFMDTEGSLPFSQEPVSEFHPDYLISHCLADDQTLTRGPG